MRRSFGLFVAVALCHVLATRVLTQSADLRVLSVGPTGELNQLQDANEIRVIFSEPMVALGRVPSNPTPAWIRVAPAIRGVWRWSGTTVLVFTPDPSTPLPYATRYTVTIDRTAASDAGHTLASPVEFSFTTPTVKLTSVRWYRRNNRFDQPVVLLMGFNQPVRADDIATHTVVRHEPHAWDAPVPTSRERVRMTMGDATGATRFDGKVSLARQAAARTAAVPVRVTADWDRERFPPTDTLVVMETVGVPTPGTWLEVAIDDTVTGAQGTARPTGAQRSTVELAPYFFARDFGCTVACNPSGYNGVNFTTPVDVERFAIALTVRDITTPARETVVLRATTVRSPDLDEAWSPNLEDAGYDRQPPARTFAYRLDPGLQASDGQTLGYPWVGVVENWHERAFTSFGDGHGVWESAGGPTLPFYSRNFRDVTQWIVRLATGDLVPRLVQLERTNFQDLPPGTGTARRLTVTPDATQSYGIDLTSELIAGTGLVWAGVRPGEPIAQSERAVPADGADRSTIVQITNLALSVKDSPQSTLVFVSRLDNGEAVPGASVSIVDTGNTRLWRGTTGPDGVAMAPALPLRKPDNWYELSFVVTAEKDGDVAYLTSNWNEGILPWDFGHAYQLWEATDILRGSVFTDRGVYRPGEAVHVKAIVRTDTPNGVRLLPAGSAIDIRVRDGRNREVDRRTVTLNRWSAAEWTWTVPADSVLGSHTVRALIPGTERPDGNDLSPRAPQGEWLKQVTGTFLVAAYRRPDFRVDATLAANTPTAGATLSGTLQARYLFGGAMGARPVRWSITRSPEFGVPAAITERFPDERYAFGYFPDRAIATERVAGAETTLDASGTLTVGTNTTTTVDLPYRYTLEGDVEDVSRQHIANRASTVVHPAPWYIGVRRPAYFADPATGTNVDVVAVDLAGAPVAGVPVTLSLTRIQWNSVRRAEGGGFYAWDTEEVRTPAGDWTVTSAAEPVPANIPVPEGGYYVLTATARDADGRRARTDVSFYGIGRGYTAWERYDHNRISLEPERTTWKPGETARLMVKSPWETATALLTIEREGVRRYERFSLTSTQQTVEVPITEADIPNVFVSVLLVRGRTSNDPGADGNDPGKPAFRLGYAELKVEDGSRRLSVDVRADRTEYRPANTARVSVAVTDVAQRPAASEVTLWAVDYGVLSLTGYRAPDVLSTVYRDKALQVMNEDSRQRIVSRRVLTPKGEGEGGGGGSEDGAGAFRRDFRPLAFWLGSVETDASGRATRDVTLPESLTTYRIMAVAADTSSRFGSADAEITVTKPVTLLTAFPRFLTVGDRASFGAVVTNTLTTGGRAVVTIASLDTAQVRFQGATSRTIELGPGATELVRFDAAAMGTGPARVRMTVALGSESDAFEATLPVGVPTRIETTAAFGDTTSRAAERISLPAGVAPGLGGLTVSLSSTALVGLGEGARYLATYPHACAEQKASAALALLLASDVGDAFSMGVIQPADYRTRATSLLKDLERYQCSGGGFSLWPGACRIGNVYLTSYVLHVMQVAGRLGVTTPDDVRQRALNFLEAELKKDAPPGQVQWLPVWSAGNAFSVKVLAEHGRNQDSNLTRLLGMADRLPIFALSYLADALDASKIRDARYEDVIRRLTNALRVEGDQAHVEEIDTDALAWLWDSNVRATALVLDGFVRRGDNASLVPGLVRWLLGARTRGRWGNTQENATALEALVSYYRTFEADVPNMTATVAIGSRPAGTATFRGRSSAARDIHLAMPDVLRQVPAGAERELAVSREGTGRLYYTARLDYALTDPPAAIDQGIRVERRYERFVENGESTPATAFSAGDLIRVTLTVIVPTERRYVAVTDALPAGVEAVDSWFRTTATDLASDASVERPDNASAWWFERGGFEHVEKYDDRVALFATRLANGRHTFSYLVRATTAGTFRAAGTIAEAMYAPEVHGRAAATTLDIK